LPPKPPGGLLAVPPPPPPPPVEDLSLIIWRRTQEAERERLRSERALIKKKRKFSSYIRKFRGSSCKAYMTDGIFIYGEIIAHFLIY
jgi:hypothetical protein